ncbi:MAG: 50S ribosomal protein L29 [Chlamydiia bacterium]|nr:50S ribosomal protein L29 [Chlamydiia bacterium]
MSRATELRDQTVEELEATASDLYKELFGLRNTIKGTGARAEKPHLFKEKRQAIARIHTVLREKKKAMSGA